MPPVNCVFDSGAERNLLLDDMVQFDWMSSICLNEKRWLQSVTNQKVKGVGTVMLYERMEEACTREMLGNVENLAAPAFFERLFW